MFSRDQTVVRFFGPFGFPVEVRSSILFLAGLYVFFSARSAQGLIDALVLTALVLLSVLLHELGHAWGARVQGLRVRRVVLFGGGGFCETDRSSYQQDELLVAMGPIVNLALWALASLAVGWGYEQVNEDSGFAAFEALYWLQMFSFVNLALFCFNMVPVHPLDGGKLFHLLLRRLIAPERAIKITGAVGVVFSVLWWPGLLFLFLSTGWILFFAPSLRQHLEMMRGQRRG